MSIEALGTVERKSIFSGMVLAASNARFIERVEFLGVVPGGKEELRQATTGRRKVSLTKRFVLGNYPPVHRW